jgi:LEA14-like dessication related protein
MRHAVPLLVAVLLGACASVPPRDPVQVSVAGVESIPGQGMELRMLVKLRVQNPNDTPIDYDGVYVKLDVMDRTFASGVSDVRGTVPRYGEAIVPVPISTSALRAMYNVFSLMEGKRQERLTYRLEGKLNGPLFGSTRFEATGDLPLPAP